MRSIRPTLAALSLATLAGFLIGCAGSEFAASKPDHCVKIIGSHIPRCTVMPREAAFSAEDAARNERRNGQIEAARGSAR